MNREIDLTDIFVVTSSGGHLLEVYMLKNAWEHLRPLYIINSVVRIPLSIRDHSIFVSHSERDLIFLVNLYESFLLYLKYRPKLMISTGAGIAVPFALIGRYIFNVKIIYIESASSIHKPSLTGRIMRYIAHKIFVQSPAMLKFFPKGVYNGSLL